MSTRCKHQAVLMIKLTLTCGEQRFDAQAPHWLWGHIQSKHGLPAPLKNLRADRESPLRLLVLAFAGRPRIIQSLLLASSKRSA
jgi:hypothetical protein